MAVLKVPIVKAKSFIEVNTDSLDEGGDLPQEVFAEAVLLGLKAIYNRGMTKVTSSEYSNPDELKAAAMAIAKETHEKVRAGKIRFTGQKTASKASGAVMTEARRMAKAIVKELMKREKIKISQVPAREITKAANAYIEQNPEIIEEAKAEIERRTALETKGKKLDLSALKAIADSAPAPTKTLSAKEAGKTAKRKPAAHVNA